MYPVKKTTKHAVPITITKSREIQSRFCACFIVLNLLMQHKFGRVNLIGRSWRT